MCRATLRSKVPPRFCRFFGKYFQNRVKNSVLFWQILARKIQTENKTWPRPFLTFFNPLSEKGGLLWPTVRFTLLCHMLLVDKYFISCYFELKLTWYLTSSCHDDVAKSTLFYILKLAWSMCHRFVSTQTGNFSWMRQKTDLSRRSRM